MAKGTPDFKRISREVTHPIYHLNTGKHAQSAIMPLEMSNQTVTYFIDFVKSTHKLKPKEVDILTLRLKRKQLKLIGRKYKLSDERIRQIEKESLIKLKDKSYQEKLF